MRVGRGRGLTGKLGRGADIKDLHVLDTQAMGPPEGGGGGAMGQQPGMRPAQVAALPSLSPAPYARA